jgi:hypothetical protein
MALGVENTSISATNLFDSPSSIQSWQEESLGKGAVLRGFAALDETVLLAAMQDGD